MPMMSPFTTANRPDISYSHSFRSYEVLVSRLLYHVLNAFGSWPFHLEEHLGLGPVPEPYPRWELCEDFIPTAETWYDQGLSACDFEL